MCAERASKKQRQSDTPEAKLKLLGIRAKSVHPFVYEWLLSRIEHNLPIVVGKRFSTPAPAPNLEVCVGQPLQNGELARWRDVMKNKVARLVDYETIYHLCKTCRLFYHWFYPVLVHLSRENFGRGGTPLALSFVHRQSSMGKMTANQIDDRINRQLDIPTRHVGLTRRENPKTMWTAFVKLAITTHGTLDQALARGAAKTTFWNDFSTFKKTQLTQHLYDQTRQWFVDAGFDMPHVKMDGYFRNRFLEVLGFCSQEMASVTKNEVFDRIALLMNDSLLKLPISLFTLLEMTWTAIAPAARERMARCVPMLFNLLPFQSELIDNIVVVTFKDYEHFNTDDFVAFIRALTSPQLLARLNTDSANMRWRKQVLRCVWENGQFVCLCIEALPQDHKCLYSNYHRVRFSVN